MNLIACPCLESRLRGCVSESGKTTAAHPTHCLCRSDYFVEWDGSKTLITPFSILIYQRKSGRMSLLARHDWMVSKSEYSMWAHCNCNTVKYRSHHSSKRMTAYLAFLWLFKIKIHRQRYRANLNSISEPKFNNDAMPFDEDAFDSNRWTRQ